MKDRRIAARDEIASGLTNDMVIAIMDGVDANAYSYC